jgi:hypothetical protein
MKDILRWFIMAKDGAIYFGSAPSTLIDFMEGKEAIAKLINMGILLRDDRRWWINPDKQEEVMLLVNL